MFSVPFDAEGGRRKLFLCWPTLLVHCVDEHSPLWPLSRDDLLNSMYELIVVLNGVTATISKPFQVRASVCLLDNALFLLLLSMMIFLSVVIYFRILPFLVSPCKHIRFHTRTFVHVKQCN